MNQSKQFPQLSAIALAVLALSVHCQAAAQDANPAPATPNAVQQEIQQVVVTGTCLLYTSPSPRDRQKSRMPSSA